MRGTSAGRGFRNGRAILKRVTELDCQVLRAYNMAIGAIMNMIQTAGDG